MELALYLCPAPPPPQVFELLSANLLFLSLAQPLCNSYHIPYHMLSVLYLLLSCNCVIEYQGVFQLWGTEAWQSVKETWGKNNSGCPAMPHQN